MNRRDIGVQERIFRALLRLYPAWFRETYGEEMSAHFRSRLARARGFGGVAALWVRMSGDALTTAVALRHARKTRNGRSSVGTFAKDVRHAARQLVRAPLFTLGAVVLLAIGIGANTAVFTLIDALLLRPPPFDRPEEVVYVYQDSDEGEPSTNAFPAYRDMAGSPVFSAVAATSTGTVSWEDTEGPVTVVVEFTTAGYLNVLGMPVSHGRWFRPEEDVVGSAPVAVVNATTWRTRMGADPGVVGSTIRLNGQPVTIVGVGPEKLSGTYAPAVTDFWLSISATPVSGPFRVANLERREDHWYEVRARLAPGVSVQQAQAAMDALALAMGEAYPDLDRGRGITVFRSTDVRFHPDNDGILFSSGALLMAIVLTLLVLAGANLANLLLARGIGRSGEMAVRRALGAGSVGVAGLFIAEALLLSVAGGVVGVLLARWALSALHALPLPAPLSSNMQLGIDWRVGAFAVGLMAVTGILSGLAPALRSARQDVALVLREDRRSSPAGRGTVRLRNILVGVQVSASLVLILGAGLLGRSLAALQDVDTGVDAARIAWLQTSFTRAGIDGADALVALEELRTRIEALPGVARAAAATRLPAQRTGTTTTVVEGYEPPNGTGAVELVFASVTPEYFETMGLPLLEGRGFTATDIGGAENVVVITEAAARTFWNGVDPVGRRLRSQSQPDFYRTVIGVVGNAPVNSLSESARPMFYSPIAQTGVGAAYVVARTDGDANAVLRAMRDEVRTVRASLPVLSQGTLASHFDNAMAGPRFAARMMGAVSLLAMLLAGLGTYAVVAFGVARRSAELGIRMALGANRGRVIRMVIRETAATVIIGLFVGMIIAAVVAPRLASVLFGVAPLDPLTFAGSALLLLAVAGLAAYLPARRAAGADPVRSLRAS